MPQDDFWGDLCRKAARTFPAHDGFTSDFATMYGYLSNSRDRDFVVLRERKMHTEVRSERNFNRLDRVLVIER